MAIKTSFLDDAEYGASDINAITARLVAQGVEAGATQFKDGTAYNLTQLNDLTKAYATPGVAYVADTALQVTKNDNIYYVQPGTCFFGNGSVTVIDEAEIITPTDGPASYVYMVSDIAINSNRIEVSETEPDYQNNSNIVPLAMVDSSGNITDMRFYARGKLPGYQIPAVTVKKVTFTEAQFKTGYADIDLGVTNLSMIVSCPQYITEGDDNSTNDDTGLLLLNGNKKTSVRPGKGNYRPPLSLYLGYYDVATDVIYQSGTTWRFMLWGREHDVERTLIYV